MNEMYEVLWFSFKDLWKNIGAKGNARIVFNELVKKYSEKHRKHHVIEHIYYSLLTLSKVWPKLKNPYAVVADIWFHDAIWEPLSLENEERSAIYAWRILEAAKVNMDFIREVMRLIRLSKHDQVPKADDIDAGIALDIDLVCLGAPWEDFQRYNQNVWAEYETLVDPEEFRRERKKILEGFYNRKPLYLTDFFRDQYEQQAKKNLKRALAEV